MTTEKQNQITMSLLQEKILVNPCCVCGSMDTETFECKDFLDNRRVVTTYCNSCGAKQEYNVCLYDRIGNGFYDED